jgi:hypothetical protein
MDVLEYAGVDTGGILGVYTFPQERFCAPLTRQFSIFIYMEGAPSTPAPPKKF